MHGLQIKRHGPQGLRDIDRQHRPDFPAGLTDGVEVDEGAVRPMAVSGRHDLNTLPDLGQEGPGPVAIRGRGNGDDLGAPLPRSAFPRQVVARKLFVHHDNPVSAAQCGLDGARGRAAAVARRRNDGVAVGIAAEYFGSQPPHGVRILEKAGGLPLPGMAFCDRSGQQPVARGIQKRRIVSGIEIGDLRRNVEQVPLRR